VIQIKPKILKNILCECGGSTTFSELLWQGLHVCEKYHCNKCGKHVIISLPVNQSFIDAYTFFPDSGLIKNTDGNIVGDNWYSLKLKSIASPVNEPVQMDVEIFARYKEVIILNTLDYVYGHSLLFLLNLQRIIKGDENIGIIVIVQPMLRWLVPRSGIAEIWCVKLGFRKLYNYYPDLTAIINYQLDRFEKVHLSEGHLIPTNKNIDIEKFSGIKPYSFSNEPVNSRITFIWREDPDRLWIRNIYLLKGCKKLGLSKLLLPFHFFRVLFFFNMLKRKSGINYIYTVTGLGRFGKLPSFIDDQRVRAFDEDSEKRLCEIYSESKLVIGVHGSGMLLPSAHAGMTVSLMPSKRWGNFAEDILFREQDIRLATFQKRVVPLNLCIYDLRDIVSDMISGRDYFIKKFIHSDEL